MKRLLTLAVLLFACSTLWPTLMYAAGCSNASLLGVYGYHETGLVDWVSTSNFTRVGLFTFDGKGKGTFSYTFTAQGTVESGSTAISYSVAPDCTLTYTHESTSQQFSGVIVNNGQQLDYAESSGWWFVTGQATKVRVNTQNN